MATDENVIPFPKNHVHTHEHMYMAKIKVSDGEYRMVIEACNMGCVFATIMQAVPEDEMVQGVMIVNVDKKDVDSLLEELRQCNISPEPSTSA